MSDRITTSDLERAKEIWQRDEQIPLDLAVGLMLQGVCVDDLERMYRA